MRRVLAALVLVFAATAADASAGLPTRDCGSRGEGSAPITRLAEPGDLRLGPVAFKGLAKVGDPKEFSRFAVRSRGRYLLKTPLFVRAGKVVTVSVVGQSGVGLTFAHRASARGVPRVRFVGCDRDEPAFAYSGKVGGVTAFPGGFSLRAPACVAIRLSVRGDRRYSATVPFGTGGCGLARLATL